MALSGKRKREEEPPSVNDRDAWAAHPRLRRHLECLQRSAKPDHVFQRYLEAAHSRGQRNLVHVAAWVSLLPDDSELLVPAVACLEKLLETRPREKLNIWLYGTLCMVARRIDEVLHENVMDTGPWKALKRQMPRTCLMRGVRAQPAASKELLESAISQWETADSKARKDLIEELGRKFEAATAPDASDQEEELSMVLRGLVAAVSPPRTKATLAASVSEPSAHSDGPPKARQDSMSRSAASSRAAECRENPRLPIQRMVRLLLIKLIPWLDLESASTQAPIEKLRDFMRDFGPVEDATASEDWRRISSLLDGDSSRSRSQNCRLWTEEEDRKLLELVEDEAAILRARNHRNPGISLFRKLAKDFGRSPSGLEGRFQKLTYPEYAADGHADVKHKSGVIKAVVTEGMQRIGGEATFSELCNFIRQDKSLWERYSPDLKQNVIKYAGSMMRLPQWEHAIRGCKFLEPTGKKREGIMLHRLKESSNKMPEKGTEKG